MGKYVIGLPCRQNNIISSANKPQISILVHYSSITSKIEITMETLSRFLWLSLQAVWVISGLKAFIYMTINSFFLFLSCTSHQEALKCVSSWGKLKWRPFGELTAINPYHMCYKSKQTKWVQKVFKSLWTLHTWFQICVINDQILSFRYIFRLFVWYFIELRLQLQLFTSWLNVYKLRTVGDLVSPIYPDRSSNVESDWEKWNLMGFFSRSHIAWCSQHHASL